jgi:hypothetical protein
LTFAYPLPKATIFDSLIILENGRGIVKGIAQAARKKGLSAIAGGTCYTDPVPALPGDERRDPMNTFEPQDERILRRIPGEILILSAVLALAVGFLFDPLTAVLFFAGGALAAAGFLWLKQSLTRFLLRDRAGALRSGILLYILRLALICAVFFIIILLFPGKILAFGAGFSTIILVFLAEGVGALLRMKTWKA